jgi:hypothetical protein
MYLSVAVGCFGQTCLSECEVGIIRVSFREVFEEFQS